MIYKNKKSGRTVITSSKVIGDDWEEVKAAAKDTATKKSPKAKSSGAKTGE